MVDGPRIMVERSAHGTERHETARHDTALTGRPAWRRRRRPRLDHRRPHRSRGLDQRWMVRRLTPVTRVR